MKILTETLVIANSEVAFSEIEGRTILIKAPMSTMHTLNNTGGLIWKNLQNEIVVSNLVDLVCDNYDAEKDVAEADVLELLEALYKLELINVKS